ncbi:putative membrane protein [Heliobacterium gestii]|nr:putative membrane protein [Heliomicrobium gestii]
MLDMLELTIGSIFIVFLLLFVKVGIFILLIIGAYLAYKRFTSPAEVAKRRYAKGEITFQELQDILKNLEVMR